MADTLAQFPFDRFSVADTAGVAGVRVQPRNDLSIATLIARNGPRRALTEALQASFGLALPDGPMRNEANGMALLGTGPRTWLAMKPDASSFVRELREALGAHAAITDQSDGYAVLYLSGPHVRALLAKGVPVDLHVNAFPVNRVVATTCAHIGVVLWRLADEPSGDAVFEMASFRSYAADLWHWLEESAAEFGLAKTGPVQR